MRYKNTDTSLERIGRELGVSYVLEGSVRQSGGRVRVTAQLVNVADQMPLWSDSVERPAGDILALQSDLAQAMATEIGIQLVPDARRRRARRAPSTPPPTRRI